MLAALVLITGVSLVLVAGSVYLIATGQAHLLPTVVPLAPWLVAFGCVMLILSELILFFGGKDDRRAAFKDLGYLLPTLIISAGVGYLARYFLW